MGELVKTLICLLLLSIFFSTVSSANKKHHKPCKTLDLYFHDILYNGHNAANATAAIIGAPAGANLTTLVLPYCFGDLVAFDDPITLDNNLLSPPVGRAQGMYLYDSKSTFAALLGFSFVLNSTSYHGSINFLGGEQLLLKTRDISVVGGTGDFFMHRGIATIITDYVLVEATYFRVLVQVKFYECW